MPRKKSTEWNMDTNKAFDDIEVGECQHLEMKMDKDEINITMCRPKKNLVEFESTIIDGDDGSMTLSKGSIKKTRMGTKIESETRTLE